MNTDKPTESGFLCVTMRSEDRLVIGDDIEIVVMPKSLNWFRVGIRAPLSLKIRRVSLPK